MKKTFVFVVALISGCTTVSHPVSTGRDTYLLSTHGVPWSAPEVPALEKAGQFCQSHGKVIEVMSINSTRTPDPRAQIQFKCVDASQQHSAELRKDNGITTIEVR